jgi:hypothetical protein
MAAPSFATIPATSPISLRLTSGLLKLGGLGHVGHNDHDLDQGKALGTLRN